MRRRAWVLSLLAVAVVGGVLVAGPTASADVQGRPGIRLVSHDATGGYPDADSYAMALTDDGRYLWLSSQADLVGDGRGGGSYFADVETGAIQRPPQGRITAMSSDGRWFVVDGMDAFGNPYRFRYDRTTGTYRGIGGGQLGRAISDDGEVVLSSTSEFQPSMSTYVHWYATDVTTGTTTDVDGDADGASANVALLSRDGTTVVFTSGDPAMGPGIGDGRLGVFRRDLVSGSLELLTVGSAAMPSSISADGTVVTVLISGSSRSSRLVTPDGVRDLAGDANHLTPDGRYLLLGGSDGTFARLDRYRVSDGSLDLVTALPSGEPADGQLVEPSALSANGDVVAFTSTGDGIVPGTVHGAHLYRRSISRAATELVCCNISSSVRTADEPLLSADGRRITFRSWQRLEPADTYDHWDLFAAGDYPPLPATTTTTTSTTLPPPVVSVADTHVAEDAGRPMTWTLSLDRPAVVPVSVRWWTFQDTSAPSDRRAAPDKDFKPAAGSVTFAPGEMTKTVSSLVFDDSFFERDEWFVIELFDPTGATTGRPKATGTINDDESARLWGLPTQLTRLLPA